MALVETLYYRPRTLKLQTLCICVCSSTYTLLKTKPPAKGNVPVEL